MRTPFTFRPVLLTNCLLAMFLFAGSTIAQSIEGVPGYERFRWVSENQRSLVTDGRVRGVVWAEDGSAVYFEREGQHFRFDLNEQALEEVAEGDVPRPERPEFGRGGRGSRYPGRARQREEEPSPDGKWNAKHVDWNVVLEPTDGGEPIQVTTEGDNKFRYGTACWVYGEELDQNEAMWWSSDSSKLAYYELDERGVRDYYLTGDNTEQYTTTMVEGYPKAGEPNPVANLIVYNLEDESKTRIKVGDDPEQYVYDISFTPDGSDLLFHRTNRHQNVMELMAANPETGESRLVVREEQPCWQENSPGMRYLEDGERFIWETEKSGYKHYELRHLDGSLINPLTRGEYPVASIARVDEERGYLFYLAYSGDNPLNQHLHRVRLDGTGDKRLTSRPLNHTDVELSPDGAFFIATYEAVDTPPGTAIYDVDGNELSVLATSDTSRFEAAGLPKPELFTFKADDGVTDLYGVLYRPSHFDPNRSYPLIIDVYGGPLSSGVSNRFRPVNAYTEFGVLVAKIDNRGTRNRGKQFETAAYLKLGQVDLKDQADGVRHLAQRPYVDAERVGIYGHSYGGYMSALAVLKHPDVFHVAVAGAPVTDWRNYDTIYTERFMRTPQENPEGYDLGSCMTYADQLEGKLLLLHGLVDDNVHPANTWQLVDALQRADKPFEIMVYPRSAHGLMRSSGTLRWQFLLEHLNPEPLRTGVEDLETALTAPQPQALRGFTAELPF